MKKGILPLKLFLTIIVLVGITFSFLAFANGPDGLKDNQERDVKTTSVKASSSHLAKVRNNQVTGIITPNDFKVVQEGLNNIGNSRAIDMEWMQLGPDNFGGRTRAIHFDNQATDNPIAYAGAVSGGLWKSENLGTTWQKINMESYNLNVSSIAQLPNGNLFVGTGELFDAQETTGLGQMGYTTGFMGQGIFKSTDGDNFKLLESTAPQFNDINSDWAFVNELAADQSSGRLYAATNTGLKYSNDEGVSWSTAKDVDGNELTSNASDVQVSSDGFVIASIDNMCYVSNSGNVNGFINRSTGDSISLPETGVNRIEFAIAPSDPNIVYASVVNHQGHVYNIYRSDDKGTEWRIVLPGTPSIPIFSQVQNGSYNGFGQGAYSNAITVFQNDPDRILLGGIDAWQGAKIQEDGYFEWRSISESFTFSLFPTYVHESHHTYAFFPGSDSDFLIGNDGGVRLGKISGNDFTYEISNRNYFTTQFYTVGYSGVKEYVIGGTQSNGIITLPGIGNTDSEGFQFTRGTAGPCVISSIAPNISVGGGEAGFIRRSDDFGVNVSSPDQFPGSIGNPDAFRTPMLLVENFSNENSGDSVWFYPTEFIAGGTTVNVRSQNSGQPFPYKVPDDIDLNPGDSIQVKDIVTAYYYLGVASGIFFTKEIHRFDKEVEWFEISNSDFGLSGTPYSMAISADGNHLFVGTLNGKLFRISNLATAYNYDRADVNSPTCIVSTQPIQLIVPGTTDEVTQVITSIAIDPQDPNNVLVTLGNYGNDHNVLFSNNALAQFPEFNSRQGNLPPMPVYSSVIEMMNPQIAIIGTDHGVFATENIQAENPQWTKQYTNMGSVPVFDLKQQLILQPSKTIRLVNGNEVTFITYPGTNNWGTIYAATFGRGLFMCDDFFLVDVEEIPGPGSQNVTDILLYPNPAHSNIYIEFNADKSAEADVYIYDISGKVVLSKAEFTEKGLNSISIDLRDLPYGTYILKVTTDHQKFTKKFLIN